MKIAILGAGALGCTIGAALTEVGNEVWMVGRSQPAVDVLRQTGLRVDDRQGSRVVAVRATTRPAEIGFCELVIVLVKSVDTEAAMRGALSLVGPDSVVMSLQNGLGHEDILAGIVGRARLVAGKTYVGGVLRRPGHVESGVAGKSTFIGELDGTISPRVRAIAAAFNAAGLATSVCDNVIGAMWDKLLVNVATGALTAITGLTYGQLYDEPRLEAASLLAVGEAIAVARAAGVVLTLVDPKQAWALAGRGLPASFKTSMLQSVEAAAVTEIDYINGSVVRWGRHHGVATPVNETLVACIKGIERAAADRRRASLDG